MTGRAPDDLAALIARVEAATGPDRDIDCRLWCLTEGIAFRKWIAGTRDMAGRAGLHAFRTSAGDQSVVGKPAYTASLDAALALVERVLPGWEAKISTGDPSRNSDLGQPAAALIPHLDNDDGWAFSSKARRETRTKTPALALILALLRALQAQSETTP